MPPAKATTQKKRVRCRCKCGKLVTLATETSHLQFWERISQLSLPAQHTPGDVYPAVSEPRALPNDSEDYLGNLEDMPYISWNEVLQVRPLIDDAGVEEEEEPPDADELDGQSDVSIESEPDYANVQFSRSTIDMPPEELLRQKRTVEGAMNSMYIQSYPILGNNSLVHSA